MASKQMERFVAHTETYNLDIQCPMKGPENAKIIIIGEYPMEQDVITNTPFSSASGKMLRNWLRKLGISVADTYFTYLVKRRISQKTSVSQGEYLLWKEALEYELSFLDEADIIISLGDSVLTALTGFSGITKYRGSVYSYNDIPVIICNSPALIQRQPENEIIFGMDIQRAKRVLNGDYKSLKVHTHFNPTYEEAMNYMQSIKDTHKRFSGDIEVVGMETACIGLAHKAEEAMCINFRDARSNRYSVEQEYYLLRQFAAMIDDPTTFSIFQNGNFDSYFMGFKDHLTFKVDFDTLLAHHTLYPRLPHSLQFLTSQYVDHPYYKDEKDTFKEGGDIESFWTYNGSDCGVTFAAAEQLEKELKEQNLYSFFMDHVMRLQPHLSKTTVTGVAVNYQRKDQLSEELAVELEKLLNDFQSEVKRVLKDPEYKVAPSSPKQVAKLLFDDLGLHATRRSTDVKVREKMMKDNRTSPEAKEILTRLNAFAEQKKFYSTYVNTAIDEDNRYRSEFKQFGVSKAPGRLSSGKTLWGTGGNSQNQPYRAYEMYAADHDCCLIYFDLAQAEARYVAWDANIEHWKEDFERARLDGSFDAHRSLAATMFNKPYDDIPKNDVEDAQGRKPNDPNFDKSTGHFTDRYIAKRCRHGLNYRMMIGRLAETAKISYGQAARNFYIYHRTNPELEIWWSVLEREVRKKSMLFNSFGRRLYITERLDNTDALDSIIAFRPQSTIGDKVQQVWYECHEDDRWDMTQARIAINVHDALYGIATHKFAKTALSLMKGYAEKPIVVNSIVTNKAEPMIIPADMKISMPNEQGLHLMANMSDIDIEPLKVF